MSNPAWGSKHNCLHCAKPFYDMHKTPATCPTCKKNVETLPAEARSNLLNTEQISTNDNQINVGKSSEVTLEEIDVDLDFSDDIGLDLNEYFEDDIDEIIDIPENPYQERI